ncbi:undecaprenyl-phosphate glucose phosphotransferase [Flavobacteriaceae bacterium F08102]|nr:undecaprenyl-phosphate glucose phosphotransferase [Flavobacteriaceae bacterium F08102]
MVFYVADKQFFNVNFLVYISLFWLVIAYNTNFYKVFRFTKIFRILKLLFVQFSLFFLGFFAYFGVFKEGVIVHNQLFIFSAILVSISLVKLVTFYGVKYVRQKGKDSTNIIIIGLDDTSKKMANLFRTNSELGYKYLGFFSDDIDIKKDYLGSFDESFEYCITHKVDEIFCTLSVLSNENVKEFTKFGNEHKISVKLIPDSTELFSKYLGAEYYDSFLVLNVKKLPFESAENHIVKRLFDVIFAIFICVFVMSWLIPILWVLIKLESKGPLFFTQKREGIRGETFTCYKFRSMKLNDLSDKIHATKNDERVTKIGGFLRRTSLDELPQFFNVLKGDMSVVGPRPHMTNLSKEYQKEIDNYIDRFAVKPGITGLAQVSGYRGEVKKKADIKNRIRLDIFYIENWSFFLDLKIIFQTMVNIFTGEEKAY